MGRLQRILRHRWLDESDTRRAIPAEVAGRLAQRVAASEQQVDQHPVVLLGVPHAQLAEHRNGAVAWRRIAPQVAQAAPHLSDVPLAGVRSGRMDRTRLSKASIPTR